MSAESKHSDRELFYDPGELSCTELTPPKAQKERELQFSQTW